MAFNEMQKRHLNNRINATIVKPLNNVKCDVVVSVKIKKPNLLHDRSHGVDLTMCKIDKLSSILEYHPNIASNQVTGTQSYALTKTTRLTALKAVELGSLVLIRVVSIL